jgi:hypothetical protein
VFFFTKKNNIFFVVWQTTTRLNSSACLVLDSHPPGLDSAAVCDCAGETSRTKHLCCQQRKKVILALISIRQLVTKTRSSEPTWAAQSPNPPSNKMLKDQCSLCVCLLLQYILQSCSRGGRGIGEDMCCESKRPLWTSLSMTH